MTNLKTIICIESIKKYEEFLDVIKNEFEPILIITDLIQLEKELRLNQDPDDTIIFIDHIFLNQMEEQLFQILRKPQNKTIGLFQDNIDLLSREAFLDDILVCKSKFTISKFLYKLKNNLTRQQKLDTLEKEVQRFYNIGKELSAEKDINKLLQQIMDSSMEMTSADAGTIYIVVNQDNLDWTTYERNSKNQLLKFVLARNNSLKVELESTTSPISKNGISGYAVITGQSLRIDDAYDLPSDVEYQFNSGFDQVTGYRTKSILTVPMKDHRDRVLGVIQLINKMKANKVISFSDKDEMIIYSLAGQAAVIIENNIIYKNMEELLEKNRLTISDEITKRKQADEEINKLLSAIEHSPSSVIITDINGYIQYINPKFTQVSGYTYKEVIGKNVSILKSGIHPKEMYIDFWKTILSGKEWSGEFYNKKKNGELYWESTSVSSIKDENGTIKYFISVREDITEKKILYKKIEEQNIVLQKTIRKLNDAQSQLIQKEKMAGIGQLAAGIAHEINNPLGFITSNYHTFKKYTLKIEELLQKYKDALLNFSELSTEKKEKILDDIIEYEKNNKIAFVMEDLFELLNDTNEGLERIKMIVNALRAFSSIDQLNEFSPYDLNEGIKTALIIAKSKITYDTNINEELTDIPNIIAIGAEINQVILNLILNAAYAIEMKQDSNEGMITIRTYQKEEYVYCEIEDNGIGIKEELINRIYEPFFTTKPVGTGTGLGLSISYDIVVNKHQGEISVESKEGIGSKFVVKLPIKGRVSILN
ncbi:ATP-binding protein [Tepidibacillus decaturensis]|uniref:ATP-binding protein n=1 Tax=Tepidibacillus decaturensis TaxID=1413211 RepID=UPI0009EB4FD6|nr:ATP-binding protein [Tepidibacillus decaturensis]